MLSDNDSEI